jgi:hypothetical protein
VGTLKITLDDETLNQYRHSSRDERNQAKQVFSFFVRRETGAIKELIEQEEDAAGIRDALSFVKSHRGFPLGYHKQKMTREELNAR